MTKQEATQKIKEADLILVAFVNWGRSRAYKSQFPYFQLWALNFKNKRLERINVEECRYWDKRKEAYAMTFWEGDKVFELIYSITGDRELISKLYAEFRIVRLY